MSHFNNNTFSTDVRVNSTIEWLSRKDEEGALNFVKALNDAKEHSGHVQILKKLRVKVIRGIVYDDLEEMQEHT